MKGILPPAESLPSFPDKQAQELMRLPWSIHTKCLPTAVFYCSLHRLRDAGRLPWDGFIHQNTSLIPSGEGNLHHEFFASLEPLGKSTWDIKGLSQFFFLFSLLPSLFPPCSLHFLSHLRFFLSPFSLPFLLLYFDFSSISPPLSLLPSLCFFFLSRCWVPVNTELSTNKWLLKQHVRAVRSMLWF